MQPQRRKTRVTLIPFIQVLSLVLVFALPVVWAGQVYTSSPAHYDKVVVGHGDTVWSLVAKRAAEGSDLLSSNASEIAAIEREILVGMPDLPGLYLALRD